MNAPDIPRRSMSHAVESATLADVLERILDKGLVIAGDVKIKIVDIELLTIQIRLVVCSVDKAREMGIDWWTTNSYLCSSAASGAQAASMDARIARLEAAMQPPQPLGAQLAAGLPDGPVSGA
ncbi:MAG: gas vesicle protein [Rhodoferax sp.]